MEEDGESLCSVRLRFWEVVAEGSGVLDLPFEEVRREDGVGEGNCS